MRVFENLDEAIPEIRRDLSKSPVFPSHRVQHLDTPDGRMREAMNYGYTILPGGIPEVAQQLRPLYLKHFPDEVGEPGSRYLDELLSWASAQIWERTSPAAVPHFSENPSDRLHPVLGPMHGNMPHPAYTYGERMFNAVTILAEALKSQPETRRAFWPIYHPIDAMRISAMTRIPCSIGYQLALRSVPDGGRPFLHLTYLSRSCDFEKFWLTDIWMAYRFQHAVYEHLKVSDPENHPRMGSTSHFILSLHRFEDADEEHF